MIIFHIYLHKEKRNTKNKTNMKQNLLHKQPTSLAFITTDKCTASCHNCCFKCSPKNAQRLSLSQITNIIEQVMDEFDEVNSCVFTGGECTLLGNDLLKAIEYASNKELICRIVSNGYWAISEEKAYNYLKELVNCGLRELNLSTGDEHQKWVSVQKVINACKAAKKLNLYTAVNIESTPNSSITSALLLKDKDIKDAVTNGQLLLKDSTWIEFDEEENLSNSNTYGYDTGGCPYLFNTISVSPDMHLLACCGLTCQESRILKIGNITQYPIRKIWEAQFDDLLKLWLYTHGPHEIHKYTCRKTGKTTVHHKYPHICSMCQHILKDPDTIRILKENINGILPNVLYKYKLLTNT